MSSTTTSSTQQNNNPNEDVKANDDNESGKERISTKLRRRLSILPPTASKESIRTVTRWILFHVQHHPRSLLQTLRNEITSNPSMNNIGGSEGNTSSSHLNVCWNVIHETCTSYSQHDVMGGLNEEKWSSSSLHDFRIGMAETVIRPGLEHILSILKAQPHGSIPSVASAAADNNRQLKSALMARDKLQGMAQIWQQLNCFDSVTLVDELKRIILKIVQEQGSDGDGEMGRMDASVSGVSTSGSIDAATNVNPTPTISGVSSSNVTKSGESAAAAPTSTLSSSLPSPDADQKSGDDTTDIGTAMDDSKEKKRSEDEVPPEDDAVHEFETGNDDDANDDYMKDDHADDVTMVPSKEEPSATATASASKSIQPPVPTEEDDEMMAMPSSDNEKGSMDEDDKEESTKGETKEKEKDKNVANEFDFESEGIPKGKVEVNELKEPCTAIATMQITRDLRNDSSYNLSSLLSKVPSTVMDSCKVAKNAKDAAELKDAISKIPIESIPDDVLDLDVATALSNVKLHREIIQQQKECRRRCIELLVKSRCQFGSAEAAELFYSLHDVSEKLKKRKALTLDAMELEGLDFEALGDGEEGDQDDKDLGEFSWLSREQAESAKKQRTED